MKRSRRRSALFLSASLAASAYAAAASFPAALAQTPPVGVTAPASPPAAALQADALSIGPGLFTFPQIAAFLSTPEQPITCDFSMKDRAAFVFLQKRSRSELKDLLGAGLQVEFVLPDAPAGVVVTRANAPSVKTQKNVPAALTMVRQKAVAEREADWLKRAAHVLQAEMDRKIVKVLSYGNKPYADMEKADKIAQEADAVEKEVGAPPYRSPPATDAIAQKRARLAALSAAYSQEENIPSRAERLGAVWARAHPPAIIPLVQGKRNSFSLAPVPTQGLESEWVTQALREKASRTTKTHSAALPEEFSPEKYIIIAGYSGGVRSSGMSIGASGSLFHQMGFPYDSKVPLIPSYNAEQSNVLWAEMERVNGFGLSFARPRTYTQSDAEADAANFPNNNIPAIFTLLGQDAVAWWTKEQEDTVACLKNLPDDIPPLTAPATSVRTPPRLYDRIRTLPAARAISLSDALEGWTARTNREAVMELHPRVELWETWDPVEAPEATNKTTPCLPLSTWIHTPEPFIKERYIADQWSVRETNKVLLITSRMEFVERPQNAPLAELIALQGDLQAWYVAHPAASVPVSPRDAHFLPFEPLAAYTRTVIARREGRTWDTVLTLSDYHNIYFRRLDETMLALFLWGKLSKKEQARLLTPPPNSSKSFVVSVPMLRFGAVTLTTLIDILRDGGESAELSLLPEYQHQLETSDLQLYVSADPNPKNCVPGYYAVSIGLHRKEGWTFGNAPRLSAQLLMPIPPSEKTAP